MSHQSETELQFKSVEALKDACADLGLEVKEDAGARQYTGFQKYPLVVKLKGPYDVGLTPQPDGTLKASTDWFAGHVERELGKGYGKLKQAYGVRQAMMVAKRKGYMVQRSVNQQGEPVLRVHRRAR